MPAPSTATRLFDYASNAAATAAGLVLYNAADIDWTGTSARVDPGAGASEIAIKTATWDTTAWGGWDDFLVVAQESDGYAHRFLLSFNDWTLNGQKLYQAYIPGVGWYPVIGSEATEADIFAACRAFGLGVANFSDALRDFPASINTGYLSVLVHVQRETGGGNGAIESVSARYGSFVFDIDPPQTSLGTFPVLSDGLVGLPDWDYSVSFANPAALKQRTGRGYQQTIERTTGMVRSASLTWESLTSADAATMEAFLESARSRPFAWQPYGEPASLFWKATGPPSVTGIDVGVATVSVSLQQDFL